MPSSTLEAIAKQTRTIAKLERKIAQQKNKSRQLDTRHKILLGGLVVKAKLDTLSLEILLDGLTDIDTQLAMEPALLNIFQAKGEAVFLGHLMVRPLRVRDWLDTDITFELGTSQFLIALKKATRRKIQMGGIILKTQLTLLNKAQLLGALVWLNEKLQRQY